MYKKKPKVSPAVREYMSKLGKKGWAAKIKKIEALKAEHKEKSNINLG